MPSCDGEWCEWESVKRVGMMRYGVGVFIFSVFYFQILFLSAFGLYDG